MSFFRKKSGLRRLLMSTLCMSMLASSLAVPAMAASGKGPVTDAPTVDTYDPALYAVKDGTRDAGSVWSDKTVYSKADGTVKLDGHSFEVGHEFLVAFSALGSRAVIEQTGKSDIIKGGITDTGLLYTDQLGEYMTVKQVDAVILDGKTYKVRQTDAHKFMIEGLTGVTIYTSSHASGETLCVKISPEMLPYREDTVTLDRNGDVTGYASNLDSVLPIRVLYSVGFSADVLTDGAFDLAKLTKADSKYVANHTVTSGSDSYVSFYAGAYDEDDSDVGAYVSFHPAETNDFYHFRQETQLFHKSNGSMVSSPVTSESTIKDNDTLFYYQIDGYMSDVDGEGMEAKWVAGEPGSVLVDSVTTVDGKVYAAADTVRQSNLDVGHLESKNATKTADYVRHLFDDKGQVIMQLGNNGIVYASSSGVSGSGVADDGTLAISLSQSVNGSKATSGAVSAAPGSKVRYSLTVTNKANYTVSNVNVSNVIPASLVLDNSSISLGGSVSGNTLNWAVGPIPAGESQVVSFEATVPTGATGSDWSNQFAVTYGNTGSTKNLMSNTVTTRSVTAPILYVSKTQATAETAATTKDIAVDTGDTVTYTVSVKNTGNMAARDVQISDVIPSGLVLDYDSVKDNAANLSGTKATVNYTKSTGTLNVTLDTLAVNSEYAVSFNVSIPESKAGVAWTNTAKASCGNHPDNTTSERVAFSSNAVRAVKMDSGATLSITKQQALNDGVSTTDNISVIENDIIRYTLTIKNNGTSTATNLVITDAVPKGLEILIDKDGQSAVTNTVPAEASAAEAASSDTTAAKSTDASKDNKKKKVSISDNVITWHLDELAPGASATYEFSVRVPSVSKNTDWVNNASVSADGIAAVKSNDVTANQVVSSKVIAQTGVEDFGPLVLGICAALSVFAAGFFGYVMMNKRSGRVSRNTRRR